MPYKNNEERRAHYVLNKEKFNAKAREYYSRHKEKICALSQAYYDSHREKACAYAAKRRHGLDPEWFIEKRASQNDCCACCGNKFVTTPCTDHDHTCCPARRSCANCRRDLLCAQCNSGLGNFKDSPLLLQKAIDYLAKHAREIIVKGA
jgi:hypothetical protein